MNRNKRVVTARTTGARVFARKGLRTQTGVDHQDVVGAASVQQSPKNDFLIERKIAAVRGDDGGLEPGLREGFEQRERCRLTRQGTPPALSARCSSESAIHL